MTYARDPFDTDEPPCLCGQQAPDAVTTPEFCPACGDPDKPGIEQGGPADPLSRPCPYCGAEAGQPCIMAGGLMQTTHYSRDDVPEPPDLGDDPDGDNTIESCEMDGHREDTYGGEHYWHCGQPGALTVDGMWLCLDHAGERGHGPLQEDYGFDPDDGLNPGREAGR
jgi:hypothetical protein